MGTGEHEEVFDACASECSPPLESRPPLKLLGDMPAAFPRVGARAEQAQQDEKALIIHIVKDFSKRAMSGTSISTLDPETGELQAGVFLLSKDMRMLVVQAAGRPDLTCKLDAIQSITWGYETWPGLPHNFAEKLEDGLLQRLVLVQLAEDAIYIIESTVERAEWTVTALCVLCSYHAKNKGADVVDATDGPDGTAPSSENASFQDA